jgi:hypothetical protein
MGRHSALACVPIIAAVWIVGQHARAQDIGGTTPQGEAMRAEGRFLQGMAWYNFGAARSEAMNAEAQAAWNRAVQADYARDLAERADRRSAKKSLRDEREQDAAKRREETRRRWREDPTPEDIRSGLALNALAGDLADPKYSPAIWAKSAVELPPEVTIRALAFRFAGVPRFKTLTPRSPAIVAVGRMSGRDWPLSLRRPELEQERGAYQRAVAKALTTCARGNPLRAREVDAVRDALFALREKTARVVPADGGRLKQANAFLDRLDEATRIFLERDIAEELIRDVEQHRAATVGQLLAFMRKYRLLFDEADDSPQSWATYQTLYNLLKWQKGGLDAAVPADEADDDARPREKGR